MPRNTGLVARIRLGFAALRDIAKRRVAENEVRQHRQDLEAIFNAVPVGMLLVDDRVVISEINDVAARLVGKMAGQIIATRPGEGLGCIHSHDVPDGCGFGPACADCPLRNAFEKVLISGEPVRGVETEATFLVNGSEVTCWLEANFEPVTLEAKKYVVAAVNNITERKIAEQRQAALLKELQSVNDELRDFAYIVSHDLKAPLRGIRTLAEWLAADFGDRLGDEGREQIDLLVSRVNRMRDLIDGILNYSRVTQVRDDFVPVDLGDLVSDIIDALVPPPHISVTLEGPLPIVLAESTRMTQLFQNLLSNAMKYMDKDRGVVRVGCRELEDRWQFYVADNGPGIPEKHFDRIFGLFQTLSPRDQCEGTGIGLAIAKKIVQLHGGEISVESQMGVGTTFLFTLPKARTEAAHVRYPASTAR